MVIITIYIGNNQVEFKIRNSLKTKNSYRTGVDSGAIAVLLICIDLIVSFYIGLYG